MQKTFMLITNTSGAKYWSYKADSSMMAFLSPFKQNAIAKYGEIYVNRNGGWFPKCAIKTVHEVVVQVDFPPEKP